MKQPRPLSRVVIKEEYVTLTGDHVSAVLLSQIEYWTRRTYDFDRFLAEEKSRASNEGKKLGVPFMHGWIYKTAEDFAAETMMGLSANTIRTRLKKLAERGWISERNNPEHSWDRTKQYRFNASTVAASLEGIGYHLEGWILEKEEPEPGKAHGCAIVNFEDAISNAENANATAEDRGSNFEDRTSENFGAIPEITTEIINRDQQQPICDLTSVADQVKHEKSVVVVGGAFPEVISALRLTGSEEIQELIGYAKGQEPREIILDIQHAGEIIRRAGSLDAAKEKIEAASAFIAKEHKAGREINSIKGVMNRIMEMDTGGIKLGRGKLDRKTEERNRRLAEKEDKYRGIYIT